MYDYNAALEWFKLKNRGITVTDDHPYNTIIHALAMMSKLQKPTDRMISSAWQVNGEPENVLKAMLEQAEKEIADDQ